MLLSVKYLLISTQCVSEVVLRPLSSPLGHVENGQEPGGGCVGGREGVFKGEHCHCLSRHVEECSYFLALL